MAHAAASRSAGTRERIAREHRQLSELLDCIETITAPAQLALELEGLRALLEAHFAGEEDADGLHEVVGRATPHLLPAVQHLFDEHREFLADLEGLTARACELAAGPVAELCAGVNALAARLRAHEARENDLFGESVYADVGSQD
jgi:hypothetical protein